MNLLLVQNQYLLLKMINQWSTQSFCKNHPNSEAGYFLVEQPWVKFCSVCALNMALCGKKIEKQLNSQQFQRKLAITAISNDLKRMIQMHNSDKNLNLLIEELQNKYSKQVLAELKMIDNKINNLMKARDQLFQLYENEISKNLNGIFERQSKTILNSLELKKQIEYIQSNFGNIIEIQDNNVFQNKLAQWKQLLQNSKMDLPTQFEINNLHSKFQQAFQTLNQKFINFQQLMSPSKYQLKSFEKDQRKGQNHDLSEIRTLQIRDQEKTARTNSIERIANSLNLHKPIKPHLKLRSSSKKSQNSIINKSKDSFYPFPTKRKERKQLSTLNDSIRNTKVYMN